MHPGAEKTEVTVEFLAHGATTELILTHMGFKNEKLRKEHDGGWNGCFDILEKVLRQNAAASSSIRGWSPLVALIVAIGLGGHRQECLCYSVRSHLRPFLAPKDGA